MQENEKVNEWLIEKFYDITRYAVRGHAVYIIFLLTLAITIYPSVFITDCRANFHASNNLQGISDTIRFPIYGLIIGVISYILWELLKHFHLTDPEPLCWKSTGEKIGLALLSFLFVSSMILTCVMFYVATRAVYEGVRTGSEWSIIQKDQRKATEECAKAQGVKLPDGWVDPWLSLSSGQPVSPQGTPTP